MATYKELSYFVIDLVKVISDDSTITIDHALFLLNYYRNYLIELKVKAGEAHKLSLSNSLTICLNLEHDGLIPGEDCYGVVLRSTLQVPNIVSGTTASVYPINYFFNTNICMVSKERYRFVGYNKYMRNIIYVTIGDDNKVYLKSNNPLVNYLKNIKLSGIFEDSLKAGNLSCDLEGNICDVLDTEFPLESALIPTLLDTVVKILSAAAWRLLDATNDARDDLADLVAYLAKNTKSLLAKQLSE